jgi:tetrahydromethanopterin S-methyltransferase subunit B
MNIIIVTVVEIVRLEEEVVSVERDEQRAAHDLDFVEQQMSELDRIVTQLEQQLALPDWTDPGSRLTAYPQRSNTALVATNADLQREIM